MENGMKKPTQKKVKEYLKDIEANFSQLIDAAIWYEQNDKDDWATDIIGEIEKLPSEKEVELLIKDLKNRKDEDFSVYAYQRLWWALINEESEDVNKAIIDYKNSEEGKTFADTLNTWFNELDDDSDTKVNIAKFITKIKKPKP